jgi:hypothetical protein
MLDDAHPEAERFRPLRPASRRRLIAAAILGPLMWVVALVVGAWVADRGDAIALALLIAAASFAVALIVLAALYAARRREEGRLAHGR